MQIAKFVRFAVPVVIVFCTLARSPVALGPLGVCWLYGHMLKGTRRTDTCATPCEMDGRAKMENGERKMRRKKNPPSAKREQQSRFRMQFSSRRPPYVLLNMDYKLDFIGNSLEFMLAIVERMRFAARRSCHPFRESIKSKKRTVRFAADTLAVRFGYCPCIESNIEMGE